MQPNVSPVLTILALGAAEPNDAAELVRLSGPVEQIELSLPRDADLLASKAALNQAVDAARSDWLLILRARERITVELAGEIIASIGPSPRAWAYRIRSLPWYCGEELRLGEAGEGEIRLFHRRHGRFDTRAEAEVMKVQGTVIRLGQPLQSVTFSSTSEHEAYLQDRGRPRPLLSRLFVFLQWSVRLGAMWKGAATRSYLWREAGWSAAPKESA